ncbi:hypothetical protein D3261_08950 [Halococcus sp. IIIV-5B]|nr:hypothetical protein D3261_08950 [Halococcus sp. IIIV-5B]
MKGIAINAALDVVARFLKFIANSITTAMDFLIQHMVGVLTWTPHPPRGDMYMAAANQGSDSLWGGLHNQYRQLWQPFALLAAAFLTFMYLILGPHALDKLPSNVANQGLYSVAIAWAAASDVSWVMMGLILDMANLIRQGLLSGIQLESGTVGAISIALVAMIMIFLVGFWIALGSILLYGFRMVAIIALTPMMPAIFAARAIPIQGVSDIADSLWRLWLYLAILPIPVGGVLAVGFGTNIHDMLTNADVVGTVGAGLFGVIIQTGTLLAALILPYILYQRSSTSALAVGLSGTAALDKVQDHFSAQEDRVKQTRQDGRQTSSNVPSRVQNVAIKANKVGLLNRGGARADGGTRTGGGGSGGGSATSQKNVYVEGSRRRRKLER